MRGWRKSLKTLTIPALIIVFILTGCSGDVRNSQPEQSDDDPPGRPVTEDPFTEVSDQSEEIPEEAQSAVFPGPRDDGDPCREHRYQLPLGSLVTLRFEKKLSVSPDGEEIRFEIERNHWTDIGIDARIENSAIEAHTSELELWVVDLGGSGLLEGPGGEAVRKLSVSTPSARGVTGVKWLRDSYFSVSEINGRRWTERAIADISESEMTELCDGELVFRYPDPDSERVYEFALDRLETERAFFILTLDVEISIADEFPDRFSAREIWYRSNEVGRFALRAAHNPITSNLVTVSGPAFVSDCE